jgi:hypothetical protein
LVVEDKATASHPTKTFKISVYGSVPVQQTIVYFVENSPMYDTLDEVLGEKITHLCKKSAKYTGEKFAKYAWQKIRGILLCGGSLII